VKDWTICELVVELNRWVNAEESTFMRAPYARAVPRPPHLPMSAASGCIVTPYTSQLQNSSTN
jgi:hypothetical protein